MPRRSLVTLRLVSVAGLFGLALAVGLALARPLRTASIGFDSQVAVLDFARLMAGRHVEVFLSTTPKPLLTLIYGPLELLTHDWRTLAWATLVAFGVAVVLTAELARRIGGIAAWAFVGVGLAGSGALLFDVGYALAIPWALLGWSVAGLAISQPGPRYGLAGIALLVAALARLETLLIVGLAFVVLVGLEIPAVARAAGSRGIDRPPRRAWLVLVAFAAVPIMGLHDLLIYGDPFFWSTVPARYSALTARPILAPAGLLGWLIERYLSLWPLVLLGLAGFGRLIHKRAWGVSLGLLALGPGIAGFLVYLAVRHIYVPDRYAAPIDLALVLAAGIGTAGLLEAGLGLARSRLGQRSALNPVLGVVGAIILAVLATWPGGILDSSLRSSVRTSLNLAADVDQMLPALRQIVARSPDGRRWPATISATADGPTPALLLVPVPYRPRLSVDLDAPLTTVGQLVPNRVGQPGRYPTIGQFVAHDRHADGTYPALRSYESSHDLTINGVTVVAIVADPARGWWISEVRSAR